MKKQIFVLIAIYLLTTAISFAATINNPIGDSKQKNALVLTGDYFSIFPVASATYVYNEAGSATATDGEVFTAFYTEKTLLVKVTITAVTSIELIVLGRSDNSSASWGEIYTKSFAASTVNDFIIPVQEHIDYLACGLKYTGGTPGASDLVTINFTFKNGQ